MEGTRNLFDNHVHNRGKLENFSISRPYRKRKIVGKNSSVKIQLRRLVEMLRNVLPILLALPDTFGQEVFDLAVDRAEIVLRPGSDCVIELFIQPERNLFLCQAYPSFSD